MLMDPHPNQQHAGPKYAVWQLQQEVTRPKAKLRPLPFWVVIAAHRDLNPGPLDGRPRWIHWVMAPLLWIYFYRYNFWMFSKYHSRVWEDFNTKHKRKNRNQQQQQWWQSNITIHRWPTSLIQIFLAFLGRNSFSSSSTEREILERIRWDVKRMRRQEIALDGIPGLVVMGDDSCSRGCGFESGKPYTGWTWHFSHWDVVKIVFFAKKDRK